MDLRFAAKQMESMSKKAEKDAKANQAKVKKACCASSWMCCMLPAYVWSVLGS